MFLIFNDPSRFRTSHAYHFQIKNGGQARNVNALKLICASTKYRIKIARLYTNGNEDHY